MENEKDKEFKVRLLVGEPKALAYQWIVNYVDNINAQGESYIEDEESYMKLQVGELIATALDNLSGKYSYINKGDLLEGISLDRTFWDKLAILKDIDIPERDKENFFSCSC